MAIRMSTVTATTSAQNVTLTQPGEGVLVCNLDGAGRINFRVDGTTAVLDADENYFVPAAAGAYKIVEVDTDDVVVSVIASASTKVGLEIVHG